jgi:hypothetical protein
MAAHSTAPLDLRTLRKLWKPRRDSYADALLYEESRIRIHRAFTWLEHASECDEAHLDDRVLAQWAGIAALSARWDRVRKAPMNERDALAKFVRQLVAHDQDGLIPQVLERERTLVQGVFSDRYLARYFPGDMNLDALYTRRRWERVLSLLLERAALVHAQLARGGASYGSRENRTALKRASMLLDRLAIVFVQIVTNHGYADEWGDLCWPPARRFR